ncbi:MULTISPECIES: DUF2157 domain-containing protein [unclassified Roseitalea]|uniref:DUF2157 domain-containing protein n=1 Tax=unclassified Roseitalea TaxID=2639107 RepID=UPI0027403026|nr:MULTISPECIES: DUF2157 domain-containing protein [unclassified Roseitalea]
MASYLENQIKDWQRRGVVSDDVAQTLLDDVRGSLSVATERPARRFSFLRIVAGFAALSFAAAILMFISANWEAIPRLARVAGVMVLIGAGLVGGAVVRLRDHGRHLRLEEAFYFVGGAAYVGGVALVGQMYHLPGDVGQAMLGFAAGLGLAALCVRSHVLALFALGAAAWWYLETPEPDNLLTPVFAGFALFCAAGYGLGTLMAARWVRWAAIAAFVVGLLPFAGAVIEAVIDAYDGLPDAIRLAIWLIALALAVAVLWAERVAPGRLRGVPGLRRPRAGAAFGLGVFALFALHTEAGDLLPLIVVGPMTLAFALFALFAHGARSRPIRYAGYVLFVGETLFLYAETVATLLGTAGFFFAVGLTLTAIALVIYVAERRFRSARREHDHG